MSNHSVVYLTLLRDKTHAYISVLLHSGDWPLRCQGDPFILDTLYTNSSSLSFPCWSWDVLEWFPCLRNTNWHCYQGGPGSVCVCTGAFCCLLKLGLSVWQCDCNSGSYSALLWLILWMWKDKTQLNQPYTCLYLDQLFLQNTTELMGQTPRSIQPSSTELVFAGAGPSWHNETEPSASWVTVPWMGELEGNGGG